LLMGKDDMVCYAWGKSGNGVPVGGSCWSLTVPLVSATSCVHGTFVLFRKSGPLPLRMDVNLLMSRFPESVSAAMDRALADAEISELSDRNRTSAA
jgi:hypothetical protein